MGQATEFSSRSWPILKNSKTIKRHIPEAKNKSAARRFLRHKRPRQELSWPQIPLQRETQTGRQIPVLPADHRTGPLPPLTSGTLCCPLTHVSSVRQVLRRRPQRISKGASPLQRQGTRLQPSPPHPPQARERPHHGASRTPQVLEHRCPTQGVLVCLHSSQWKHEKRMRFWLTMGVPLVLHPSSSHCQLSLK